MIKDLTAEDRDRVWAYSQGAQYSGAARRKLGEMAEEKGWTPEELEAVVQEVTRSDSGA
jgi:lipocalin